MVMANHRSNLDPPLLIAFTPYYLRFLTKKELFFIPFFGWALYLMGQIPIDRKRREKAIRSLQRSRKLLKQPGIAILAFPEGTRSRTEDLLPFKKGGFVFAIENGLPILPVGIGGTGPLLPKGNFLVRPGKVTFVVGEPIPTTQYTLSTKETLMAEVREKLTFLKKEADEILSRN
jgi:1-acyl-sn-glycerol-3-phosphate acyltransferase